MDKKESFYWDLVKGIAVFLMLWGHCIQYCTLGNISWIEDSVFRFIYTFHMPVFMLVSGYLFSYSFRKRTLGELLEHRIRGMLHPIVMATFLGNVLMLIPSYFLSGRADILFGNLFAGIGNDLWFLWAVLYCSLLVAVCCKQTKNLCVQVLTVILCGGVILLVPQWNMTLFMYPYFVVGFFAGMYRKQALRLYRILKYVMLVVFPVLVTFYETKHLIYVTPIYSEELGLAASGSIALFRWAIGFAGSIWLLTIAEFLLYLGSRVSGIASCLKAVSVLGRNSLQIYCLSATLIAGYLPHIYRKFVELTGIRLFMENMLAYDFLLTPLLTVAWSVFLWIAVVLLKKYRIHSIIFGR